MLYSNLDDRINDFTYLQEHVFMPHCGESVKLENPDFTTHYWAIPEKANLAFRMYYKDQDVDIYKVINSNRFEVIVDRSCIRSFAIDQIPELMNCNVSQFFKRVELRELTFKKKTSEKTREEIRKILRRYQLNEAAKELGKTPVLLKIETEEFRRMLVQDSRFLDFLIW